MGDDEKNQEVPSEQPDQAVTSGVPAPDTAPPEEREDEVAPDEGEDKLPKELEDLKTKIRGKDKEDVPDDEVDGPDQPRDAAGRRGIG